MRDVPAGVIHHGVLNPVGVRNGQILLRHVQTDRPWRYILYVLTRLQKYKSRFIRRHLRRKRSETVREVQKTAQLMHPALFLKLFDIIEHRPEIRPASAADLHFFQIAVKKSPDSSNTEAGCERKFRTVRPIVDPDVSIAITKSRIRFVSRYSSGSISGMFL